MQIWRYFVIVVAALACLGGCQTTAPVAPATTADEFLPLALNARDLKIENDWHMSVEPPYIGYRAQTFPIDLLTKWAGQVLKTPGGSGEIIFGIRRAAVTRTKLPMEAGIGTLLTDQQESKIRADFDITIMWIQPVGGMHAFVQLQEGHSITIPESASANDLQNAMQAALLGALNSLDQQVRAELAQINNIILP